MGDFFFRIKIWIPRAMNQGVWTKLSSSKTLSNVVCFRIKKYYFKLFWENKMNQYVETFVIDAGDTIEIEIVAKSELKVSVLGGGHVFHEIGDFVKHVSVKRRIWNATLITDDEKVDCIAVYLKKQRIYDSNRKTKNL